MDKCDESRLYLITLFSVSETWVSNRNKSRQMGCTLIRATGREVTAAADIWALDNPIVPIGPCSRLVLQFAPHEKKLTYLVQSDRSRINCGCC